IRLLEPGGRLAIVLPDTYLFSNSYGWLIQWLGQYTITHSINVPIEALSHTAARKLVLLFLRNLHPQRITRYSVRCAKHLSRINMVDPGLNSLTAVLLTNSTMKCVKRPGF